MAAVKTTKLVAGRWWVAAALAVLGGFAGLVYGMVAPRTYTTTAYVLVVAENPADSTSVVSYAQAYARLAHQGEVVDTAVSDSKGTASVSELRENVLASASPDAPVIEVSGSAGTPERAAYLTNLIANGLASAGTAQARDTRIKLVLLSPAYPPAEPSSPQPMLSAAIGAAVGLLLGGLLFLTRPGGGAPDAHNGHNRTAVRRPGEVRPARLGDPALAHRTDPVLRDLP